MNIEIKYNSPLQFLDYDVSKYIYKTYFEKEKNDILNKKMVNDQFIFLKNIFIQDNNLENIYSNNNILYYPRRNIYKRLSFNNFIFNHRKYKYKKIKKKEIKNFISHQRALKYKREANSLRLL